MAIRTISLFTGAGGLDLSVHLALGDVHPICYVERDAEAAEILACRLQDGSLPEAPIWSDVTSFPAERFRGMVDGVIGGFPCFAAGTLILTIDGFRPIESLAVGDMVLTHKGRWRPITSTMQRSDAELLRVRGAGMSDTLTTSEHPYYARKCRPKWDNDARSYKRSFGNPEWIAAQDVRGCFASQVLPDELPDPRPSEFWWLVGRYLADGWRVDRKSRKNGRVVICCKESEAPELRTRIVAAGFVASEAKERTVIKFHITKGSLYEFLEPFGRLAHGKRLPGWVLQLPREKAEQLLEGWISGDGWRCESSSEWSVTTTSEALALGMALLSQRVYGTVAGIYRSVMPSTVDIEGRTCSQRDQFNVRIRTYNRSSFVEGRFGWKLVRKVEPAGKGEVFNISVQEDESYVANGAVVHNCQDLSVAGRQEGIQEGNRSGLWFQFVRVIRESECRFVYLENVPPVLAFPAGGIVLGELAKLGFDAEWISLRASDVGASHIRKRVFLFASRRDMGHTRCFSNTGRSHPLHPTAFQRRYGLGDTDSKLADAYRKRRQQNARSVSGHEETDGRTRQDECQPNQDHKPTGFSAGLADAQCPQWRPHDERERRLGEGSNRQGQTPSGAGELGTDLAYPDLQYDDGSGYTGARRRGEPTDGIGKLADTGSPRLEERGGESGDLRRECAAFERGSLPLFAPGPNDPRWADILRDYPELAPATSRFDRIVLAARQLGLLPDGLECTPKNVGTAIRQAIASQETQSAVRRILDGNAEKLDFSRTDQLRALGNAVAPACGAAALCVLLTRAGFAEWIDPMIRGTGEMNTFLKEEVA